MGIDIYAKWREQTKDEEQAQYTGFSVEAGNVGYLREAYHGSPYVTKYLVAEAFESKTAEARIPAQTLKERLPVAVLMALYRDKVVYQNRKSTGILDGLEGLETALKNVFEVEMKDESHKTFADTLTKHHIDYINARIQNKDLPAYAMSFVDFVNLCEVKEKELGEPCLIIASY